MTSNNNEQPGAESVCGCAFKVESILSVDERGQMVLPKDVRDRANIKSGEKFALVTMERDGALCCMSLIRTEELGNMVKGFLGPVMQDVMGS